ncbi:MAG: hypothetical protein M1827_001003 [Pycnora praestabilis]|nr:MAG: hypothetical protein M1827_001003 [Pycnora praestabilis]
MASTVEGESHHEKKVSQNNNNTVSTTANGHTHRDFQQVMIIQEITSKVHIKLQAELGFSTDVSVSSSISIEDFLDYVATERLRRMPHKGSKWDKVLKWAEHFATQVSIYGLQVNIFLPHSKEAASLVMGSCRALLEMGPSHAAALERAFGIFYRYGLTISFFLRNRQLFTVSEEIRQELGHAYADLLTLVTDVTVYYRKRSKDKSTTIAGTDFDSHFGRTVDAFFGRRDHIANEMWTHELQHSVDLGHAAIGINTIRQWLSPQDRTLQIISSNRMGTRGAREEFTCEWFQQHLLDFMRSKDNVLSINGRPGCGKSSLSSWIMERLQRPLGRKSYETVAHVFDADVPTQTTSLSLVKGLLLQLLEQSIGDVALYKSLATVAEVSKRTKNAAEVESGLWKAIDTALKTSGNLVVIVDGLEDIKGGEPAALELFQRLHDITASHSTIKAIVLSRPLEKLPKSVRSFSIDAHNKEDIYHFVERSLSSHHHFHDQSQTDKVTIIELVTQNANGSFVWADLVVEMLKMETTHKGFNQILQNAPRSLHELLTKFTGTLDFSKGDSKHILSWLIVAQRPLGLVELQNLLKIDTGNKKQKNNFTATEDDVKVSFGSLVTVRDGICRFRHGTVRKYLWELSASGKGLLTLRDAQHDLMTRTLMHAKTSLTRQYEPSFDLLQSGVLDELFQSNRLLEYAARYWTVHFNQSSMLQSDGTHNLSSDFKTAFSDSTLLALIERSCWETQTLTAEAIDMHHLALSIRQSVFGQSKSVLQSNMTLASTYENISSNEEASRYYYQASRISQKVVSKQSTVAFACATAFLNCTTSVISTSRTELTTQKEEMLKYVIEVETSTHSRTSDVVIKYKQLLAHLYVEIKEIELASALYREVYEACVERYGQHSEQATRLSQTLTVVMQKHSSQTDTIEYTTSVFEIAEKTMDIWDERRILATIRYAEAYESKMDIVRAEEILITLFRKITEMCRLKRTIECHERKIQAIVQYVRFLRRQQRLAEAESILIGLWAEYEQEEMTSEIIVIRIKTIGEEMRTLGMTTTALAVFNVIWSYFKRVDRQTSTEATSTAITLVEVIQEASTTMETFTQETVLREVFESSISSTTTKVRKTSVKTCETLSTYYAKNERWTEATTICQNLLREVWSSLFTDQRSVVLPKEFTSEIIEITKRLACYYVKERRVEEAEKIYLYIFRATKANLHIQDDMVADASRALFEFYEETNQSTKAISVYKELAETYRKTLGSTHILTIKILYVIGDFCIKHRMKDSEHYYLEIVTSLNKGSDVCHTDAMEAAIVLSGIYYEGKRWGEAQNTLSTLWLTFVKCGKAYKMSTEVVETIYKRYSYILEKETKVEYTVLRQVTVEYRETCIKIFGARSEITLKATMRLAEINERSETYQHEAILIYEEIFSSTSETMTTTNTTSILTEAKKRLARLYVSTTSSSSTQSERAVTLHLEQYKRTKTTYSCSHTSTMTQLRQLSMLYKKQNTQQFHTAAVQELQSFTIELITTERDSKKLFDSGKALASIYSSCGFADEGYELLRQLRRQIVAKDSRSVQSFGFDIGSIDRRSYVFLVVFEESLKGTKKISFSEVMADLLTEAMLYEHYTNSVTRQTNFESILLYGARLRCFLFDKARRDQATVLEDELFEMFCTNAGSTMKTDRRTTRVFFVLLLEEFRTDARDVRLVHAACTAGNQRVLALLNKSKFQDAYDLASCVYQFVKYHHGWHAIENYDYGLKLSLYMAGRGGKKCPESELHSRMLSLSKDILHEVLHASRSLNVNFIYVSLTELNSLVGAMGEQRNFDDLEWLLTELWNNRHSQKTWSSGIIVAIGYRLVEVRFTHKHRDSAIHLCEDIVYNCRRVWGALDKTTIEMSTLLYSLYTTAGRYHKAMNLAEEMLRQELSDDDEEEVTGHDAIQTTLANLELLKRSYQRRGSWDKDASAYKDLFAQLVDTFGHEKKTVEVFGQQMSFQKLQHIDKWSNSGADNIGTFTAPTSWEFMSREEGRKHHNLLRRVSENWAANGTNGKNGVKAHVEVKA